MDNGSSKELRGGEELMDEACYCVDCGNIFVYDRHRECPTCYIAEKLNED